MGSIRVRKAIIMKPEAISICRNKKC